ncbi:hypothetical protein JOM56_013822, partial [Amanita muscaria]
INERDKFLGENRCVICGDTGLVLQHAHIIEPTTTKPQWSDLHSRGWIPSQTKEHFRHEPRNGLLVLCSNHHSYFEGYDFFIRFLPEIQKFVFVNRSDHPSLHKLHGKAIALDIKGRHAPFPSLFIIHEVRAGFFPFAPNPDMPNNSAWQDWILSDGVFDNVSGSFKRNSLPHDSNCCNSSVTAQPQLQFPPATTNAGAASSGGCTLALNADDILAATRAMPSWKACQVEGSSWTGTAEENIQKYVSSIGIDGTGSKETARDGSSEICIWWFLYHLFFFFFFFFF